MSSPEMNIINNSNALKTGKTYWLASPYYFDVSYIYNSSINELGRMGSSHVSYSNGVRPAISLKPGTEYASGDGSMTSPYIVE